MFKYLITSDYKLFWGRNKVCLLMSANTLKTKLIKLIKKQNDQIL